MRNLHGREPVVAAGKPSCTAIVCAYNEERTLERVLKALLDSPLLDEVVAVDDGSHDSTPAILARYANHQRMRAIRLAENRGKGWAIAEAVLNAHGKILLLVDADLLNLSTDHVAQLLYPLLRGKADMVIGYPVRGRNLVGAVAPFRSLSGERALFREDFLPMMERIRTSGYGVETLINLCYRGNEKRVHYARLSGLTHPIKVEKTGPMDAIRSYTHEGLQIVQAMIRHYPLVLAAYGLQPESTWLRGKQPGGSSLSIFHRTQGWDTKREEGLGEGSLVRPFLHRDPGAEAHPD